MRARSVRNYSLVAAGGGVERSPIYKTIEGRVA